MHNVMQAHPQSIAWHRQTYSHISLETLDPQAVLSTGADRKASGHNWMDLQPMRAMKCELQQ